MVPLNETMALKIFDTNVPEVLESLKSARQPDSSREVGAAICWRRVVQLKETPNARNSGVEVFRGWQITCARQHVGDYPSVVLIGKERWARR